MWRGRDLRSFRPLGAFMRMRGPRGLSTGKWVVPTVLCLAISALGVTAVSSPGQAAQVRPSAAPSASASAYALIGTIQVSANPTIQMMASSNDDTVYVPVLNQNFVGIIRPGHSSGTLDDSIAVTQPIAVAVSQDDTLYVVDYNYPRLLTFRPDKSAGPSRSLIPNYSNAMAVSADDTVALAGNAQDVVQFVKGRDSNLANSSVLSQVSTVEAGSYSRAGSFVAGLRSGNVLKFLPNGSGVASTLTLAGRGISTVVDADDTVLVADYNNARVAVYSPSATSPNYYVAVGANPRVIALTPTGDAITVNETPGTLSLIERNAQTAQTIFSGLSTPRGMAITPRGLVYVAELTPGVVRVLASVGASLGTTLAPQGSALSIDLTGLPSGVVMDDSTVKKVWWGDDTVPFTRVPGTNSVSVTVPDGAGSVPVVVEVNGLQAVSAGTFTYGAPAPAPEPPAPIPADPPGQVAAVAGNASAVVSWATPASSGSYPVTTYRVTSIPEGHACLAATPSLSCEVTGLRNGTSYTFTVQALTGAGWSAASAPSAAVTPVAPARPTLVITGAREGKAIQVSGSSTGLGMGAILRSWVKLAGESSYTQGVTQILVSMDGTFAWGRQTGRKASVYVATSDGSVRSNRVTIAAR